MLTRLLALTLLCSALPWPAGAAQVTVFAASSLSDALQELGRIYQETNRDTIRFNFGSSSTLARQITAGAPADLFFSADAAQMRTLESNSLIVTSTRVDRLSNSLVVVVPAGSRTRILVPAELADPAVRRIAIGDPRGVPIGVYAREYLTQLGLWDLLKTRIVPTESARAALAVVESGNVDAAIVFATDAPHAQQVRVACRFPPQDSPRIVYPVARVKNSRAPEAADRFLAFLASAAADRVFVKHGFSVIPTGR